MTAALYRHGRLVALALFVLLMAGCILALYLWPQSFTSEAKLYLRVGRESVGLDPTATTGETISITTTRELELASVIEILRSQQLAERVVDALGPEMILDSSEEQAGPSPLQSLKQAVNQFFSRPVVSEREQAISKVMNSIDAEVPNRSSVIALTYEASSPELAQQILAKLVASYQEEHVRLNRTAGSFDFFEKQTQLAEQRLAEVSEKLRDAKNKHSLTTIETERLGIQEQLSSLEVDLLTANTEVAAAEARIQHVQAAVDKVPERIVTEEVSGYPNIGADGMRQKLYDLQLEENKLLSEYKEAHPRITAIRQQVVEAKKALSEESPLRTQFTTALNPAHQQLSLDLLATEATISSQQARAKSLTEQRTNLLERVSALNASEIEISRLERELELVTQDYRIYSEKLEQSRIEQALETNQISNVNVVQPATLNLQPTSPRIMLVLAAGFVLATLISVRTGMYLRANDPALSSADDVEQRLELPVLISVPRGQRPPSVPR